MTKTHGEALLVKWKPHKHAYRCSTTDISVLRVLLALRVLFPLHFSLERPNHGSYWKRGH